MNKISLKYKTEKKIGGGANILLLTLFIKQHQASSFFDASVFPGFLAFDLYTYSYCTNIFILKVILGH